MAQGVGHVLSLFDHGRERLSNMIAPLTDEPFAALEEARAILVEIAPSLAYLDVPDHPLARALFDCAINLAIYLALKSAGIEVHDFGRALLNNLSMQPAQTQAEAESGQMMDVPADARAHPGQFKLESVQTEEDAFQWGFNMTSCAICYLYGQHDAMALVPYMCASDDVISDQRGQGLRRTGTIALGARHCDFRFGVKTGAGRLAERFPDKIRFVHDR
ncbi:MAG: L-2-amino-thiazoline-4-carboxylic acid hydrolase [Pseudomonadota bacterium]|nr:L-2-amino-thiazoline-4-carboxylic acid hydrolase [Pseudomonadota bacterium]